MLDAFRAAAKAMAKITHEALKRAEEELARVPLLAVEIGGQAADVDHRARVRRRERQIGQASRLDDARLHVA